MARGALSSLIRHYGAVVGHARARGWVELWAAHRGRESCVGPHMGVGGIVSCARGWEELWDTRGGGWNGGPRTGVGRAVLGHCVGVRKAVSGHTWGWGGLWGAWGWLAVECQNAQLLSLAGIDHKKSQLLFFCVFLR